MKRLISIFCLFVCISSVNAQLLYQVSGHGLKKTSYLFGSHHLIIADSLANVENVFKYYNKCEVVVGEVVINNEKAQEKIATASKMSENIASFYTKEEYNYIDSIFREYLSIPLSLFSHLRPAMIENIFQLSLYEKLYNKGDDVGIGIDSFFQNVALAEEKKVYGLESVDKQIELLYHTQTLEHQAASLLETVRNVDTFKQQIEQINSLYLAGDLTTLEQMTNKELTQGEQFLLIEKRNNAWLSKLEKYMNENSCFIVVGAMHLTGKTGLIELLSKKGYKVKAL